MLWLVLGSSCQSTPAPEGLISPESSLLVVDVVFPARLSRDRSLVQAFFARDGAPDELPEFIPATFVKWSRAYLLDPEPGTYSLVAVTSAVAPPWNDYAVAGGVTQTRYSGTISHAMIFPAELIHRTRTAIAPGDVAFMGALRIKQGDPIDADVVFHDDLQRRIAERIRPGAIAESGLARWFPRTWLIDLEQSTISHDTAARAAFFPDALKDLGESPWARVIARAAPQEAPIARPKPASPSTPPSAPERELVTRQSPAPIASEVGTTEPAALPTNLTAMEAIPIGVTPNSVIPEPASTIPIPPEDAQSPAPLADAESGELLPTIPMPESVPVVPQTAAVIPTVIPPPVPAEPQTAWIPQETAAKPPPASLIPQAAPPEAQPAPSMLANVVPATAAPVAARRRFSSLPPGSPLAQIEFGMSHNDVRKILGDPDDRIDRITAKAWIPFYIGPGGYLRDWIYEGEGRVVFSLHKGSLAVVDVIAGSDPDADQSR